MPLFNPVPIDVFVGPPHSANPNNSSQAWQSANAARLFAFRVAKAVRVSTASFRVQTQSGNMDVGIYNDAGTRLGSTGSFAVPAGAGSNSQALTAPVDLVPGQKYWAAIAIDNATAVLHTFANTARPTVPGYILAGQVASSMPLPDPIVIPTAETSAIGLQVVYFA